MSDVYKSQPGRAPHCHNNRMRQAVQTGMSGLKGPIDRIALCKILRVIHAAVPVDPPFFRSPAIRRTHARTLRPRSCWKRQM